MPGPYTALADFTAATGRFYEIGCYEDPDAATAAADDFLDDWDGEERLSCVLVEDRDGNAIYDAAPRQPTETTP